LRLKTAESGIESVQRHLHSVEGETRFQHAQMHSGILVPRKSEESNFSLLLRFEHCFRGSALAHEKFRIVLERNSVSLPQVEMIGLQAVQGLFKHSRDDKNFGGGSEGANAVCPAAVTAAFFDATGVQARKIPLTPAYVMTLLKS
jgi:hypothetical protein